MGIPTGTPILRISRLCTADGRPAIYCEDVVEKAKLQRPYTAEELRQPIFDFLQNVCGISSYLDLTDVRPAVACGLWLRTLLWLMFFRCHRERRC